MSESGTAVDYCEHDELRAACLECLAMPKKVKPQPTAAPRATKNPSNEFDKVSPLAGGFDMSLPVSAVGPLLGSDWLPAHAFPHYLRRSGWVYLRTDGFLSARVKASKVVWLPERKVATEDAYEDLGAGMAIQVDPRSWDDEINVGLGSLADSQRHGYRYLMTHEDGSVTHYRGGRPLNDDGGYADGIELD
ncbi:MAG: hypothetical protein ACK5PP_05165 [Acidimicrobiales bacterium]